MSVKYWLKKNAVLSAGFMIIKTQVSEAGSTASSSNTISVLILYLCVDGVATQLEWICNLFQLLDIAKLSQSMDVITTDLLAIEVVFFVLSWHKG